MSKRTIVYIDGFNLYYGLLRQCAPFKWLDLQKFSRRLVSPDNNVVAVKYFTSRVNYDPKKSISKSPSGDLSQGVAKAWLCGDCGRVLPATGCQNVFSV